MSRPLDPPGRDRPRRVESLKTKPGPLGVESNTPTLYPLVLMARACRITST